jgi:glutathione synthase/RimK-type ligase-like ATP-grasp enzyme
LLLDEYTHEALGMERCANRGICAWPKLTGKADDDGRHRWYRTKEPEEIPLREFDAALTRKDPPFNMGHVYTTYLLELAETHVIPSFEAGLSP